MTLSEAIREVEQRQAERIAVPGEFKVWREGDAVKHEVLPKEKPRPLKKSPPNWLT